MDTTTETVVCPRCHGEGYIDTPATDALSVPGQRDQDTCPVCHGTGVEPPDGEVMDMAAAVDRLTKAEMLAASQRRQRSRDEAAPANSPPNVARLYR